MSNYQQRASIPFNNGAGGAAPGINASGHFGDLDTHGVSDVALVVTIGGAPTGSSQTLVVGVDMQDAAGNWISQVIKTATLNASGTAIVSGSPTFPATQISLIGR
jgi:hypothetical protein